MLTRTGGFNRGFQGVVDLVCSAMALYHGRLIFSMLVAITGDLRTGGLGRCSRVLAQILESRRPCGGHDRSAAGFQLRLSALAVAEAASGA